MRAIWDDAFLLLLAIAAIATLRGAAALGVTVPWLEGTGAAWVQRSTWQPAVAAALLAAFVAMIAASQRRGARGLRTIGWALVAAGVAAALFFHPALAATIVLAGGHLLRRHRRPAR